MRKTVFLRAVSVLALLSLHTALYAHDFSFQDDEPVMEAQRVINIISSEFSYDLNPHTAAYSSEAQILTGLYEGLFSYDPVSLDPLPALCSSYKISRDKKRWTFTLRGDCTFSDGSPITAQTFRDSWIALLSEPAATFAGLLDCVQGAEDFRTGKTTQDKVRIEVRNQTTLVVHLTQPAEHLPRILCHHAFSAVSPRSGVYSGAFVLDTYDGSELIMKKNERYRDAQNVHVPGIRILQSDNEEENTYLFNTGKADWVSSGVEASKILNQGAVHVSAEFGTSFIFLKTNHSPWNIKEFREALLEAIPYETLREIYPVKASTLVYPLAGYPSVNGIDDYDAEDAQFLMKEAREKAGIKPEERLTLVFAIYDGDYLKNMAELLKDAWAPLGVDLVTQSTPFSRYNASIPGWNADIFSYSWIGDFADPLAFLELFRSGSSLNVSGYSNPAYDALLKQAAEANGKNEHYRFLSEAEQILLDDCVIIPVYHPVTLHVIDSRSVGGWQSNALDLHPLKYLYIKKSPSVRLPNIVMN